MVKNTQVIATRVDEQGRTVKVLAPGVARGAISSSYGVGVTRRPLADVNRGRSLGDGGRILHWES